MKTVIFKSTTVTLRASLKFAFILVSGVFGFLNFAGASSQCEDLFVSSSSSATIYAAKVVKTRADQTHIFKIVDSDVVPHYFKEIPTSASIERKIFDDLEMPVVAFHVARSFHLDTNVPAAILQDGIEVIIGGSKVKTRGGLYQNGLNGLMTPIDEFKAAHQGREPGARDIQTVLNSGDWPRLYADWKIFWIIFMQTDLNIANLAKHGNDLYMFDTGDLANLPQVRAQVGISRPRDNFDFNMPDRAGERVSFYPDFRKADGAFRQMAIEIANESDEATAARLGKSLDDSFVAPRGKVRDHVHAMKNQARWVESLLNKCPFDF